MSKRDVVLAIISIAQQASPKVSGQSADLRAQLKTWSTVVMMKFFSNLFSIYPISQLAALGAPRSLALIVSLYSAAAPLPQLFSAGVVVQFAVAAMSPSPLCLGNKVGGEDTAATKRPNCTTSSAGNAPPL